MFVRTHPNLGAHVVQIKANHFLGITGNCKLPAHINFIRSISAGKLDSFRLDYVSFREERRSVIND